MASSSNSAIINLSDADLQFTDSSQTKTVGGTTHTFKEMPDSAMDEDLEDDQANLLGEGTRSGKYNFWSMEFYQQFFDVDDSEVKNRIVAAMVPRPGKSFLSDVLKKSPDLWGPIWICTTLVISVAVTGNVASYIQTALGGETSFAWHYDFHKVTLAATAVFSYAWLVPAFLYAFLWWTASGALTVLSFLDLLCLYGYSLAIYIPISVLWLIQNSFIQWVLVLVSAGVSGAVIVLTLWPIFKENATKGSVVLILVIIGLHLLLACGFMLYFFHVPGVAAGATGVAPVSNKTDTNFQNNVDKKKSSEEEDKDQAKIATEKRSPEEQKGNEEKQNEPVKKTKEISNVEVKSKEIKTNETIDENSVKEPKK